MNTKYLSPNIDFTLKLQRGLWSQRKVVKLSQQCKPTDRMEMNIEFLLREKKQTLEVTVQ